MYLNINSPKPTFNHILNAKQSILGINYINKNIFFNLANVKTTDNSHMKLQYQNLKLIIQLPKCIISNYNCNIYIYQHIWVVQSPNKSFGIPPSPLVLRNQELAHLPSHCCHQILSSCN